ncbi:MAG: serpin family protein [Planctomycetota bacterium]
MRKSQRTLIVGMILIGLLAMWMAAALGAEAVNTAAVIKGNNEFALDLYAKLSEKKGNLFFSPYSISTALAMTYAGARGDTAGQMKTTLHLGAAPDDKALHDAFGKLVGDLNAAGKKGKFKLSVANALWAQRDYKFLEEFTGLVTKSYGAGLTPLDFARQTEAARQTINAWVEKQTQDKIKELLKPGVLTSLTRLVLTNAIYFKGDWASQFDKKRTKDAPFHLGLPAEKSLAGPATVEVPMMYQKGKFNYADLRTFQILQMPYKGDQLAMVVLLPKEHHAEAMVTLEKSLTTKNLTTWLGRLPSREVMVYLPRFKMTSEFSLKSTLMAMGMKDAFTEKANLSGMDGTYMLYISAVVHKAFVDVNEEGTEAAAATAVVVALRSAAPRQLIFRADRPFIFLIRDNRTGSVLFIGRVANPKG